MSTYPSHFIDPVFSKQKQVQLKNSSEFAKLNLIPTKAALNNESLSIFYGDIAKQFTNYITRNGNKELARELLEKCFEVIKRIQLERYHMADDENKMKIITDPEKLLTDAIENCRPLLLLTAIKRGGVKYHVPVPVSQKKSYFLSMKWLLESAREKERTVHLPNKLAWEILDAACGQGRVIKKKLDLHRQCEGNRAYAHYRWS